MINNYTNDTSKHWIGTIDKESKEFNLIEPRGLFTLRHMFHASFFQVIVRGQIIDVGEKSKLKIELRLGWYTLSAFIMMYTSALIFILTAIYNNSWGGVMDLTTWLLCFPVLGTLFLILQLNKVENKIIDLFGL